MLKGEHVGLRAIERNDLQQLRDWRNLPQLRKNFREFRELSLEHQLEWFERINSSPDVMMFIIETLTEEHPVGVCGITHIDWQLHSAELSIYVGEQGKYIDDVFAVDSSRVLLDYAFNELNLHKIWGEVYAFDHLKAQLFQDKLGFKQDGILRDNCFTHGCYHDSLMLSLLSDEWLT